MDVTIQDLFTSHTDLGLGVAIDLVNDLAIERRAGDDAVRTIAVTLSFDPPTHSRLRRRHVAGFIELADTLHQIMRWIDNDDLDAAAERLNQLLAEHPANPHLAKADGHWQLHHHPATIDLVPMYTSICAEILARLIGTGHARRLGLCNDQTCGRAYFDRSKNTSRQYCSLTCQNRAKTAAFRARHRNAST
jgi:predicted RNA-binding Zn ribbon-like protein